MRGRARQNRLRRVPARLAAALVAALIGALALCSASVHAATATTHPFLSSFDGSGTPQETFTETSRGGLAIDQSNGRVAIVTSEGIVTGSDVLASRVDIFDSSGNYLSQVFQPPLEGFRPVGVAIDNSSGPAKGRIYVANSEEYFGLDIQEVAIFDASGNYLSRIDGANTPAGSFGFPGAVAVDSTGKVYVLDTPNGGSGNSVLDIFDASGNYLSQRSGAHIIGHVHSLAFDASDNLYAAEVGTGIVKFDSAGVFQFTFGTDRVTHVAVDPASGDVYAAEGRYISQYDSAGNLLGRFGYRHLEKRVEGIGVHGASGKVYAIDHQNHPLGLTPFLIDVFGPGASVTAPDATIGTSTEVAYFDATLHGTVNPRGVPTAYHFEYRGLGRNFDEWISTPEQSAGSGEADLAVSTALNGLEHKTGYEVRLVATNEVADVSTISEATDSFTTLTVPPVEAATIDPATSIATTSAHLSGTLTMPVPGFPTTYQFQYSTDGSSWNNGPSGSAGSATGEVAVSGDLSGLIPNTQYFVRLSGKNQGGGVTSAAKSFTTKVAPPSMVETLPPGKVENTSVLLGGFVNPNNTATSYWFEYGPEDCASSACTSVPASQDASAGSGISSVEVTQPLADLEPDTTYHYRIVAKNSAGTIAGNDIVFATDDPDAPGPPDRGFEMVSNPDKGNQPVAGGQLLADGEHIAWSQYTAPGSPAGTYALFRASRTPTGWQSHTLLPPIEEMLGHGTKGYAVSQISGDGTRFIAEVASFFGLSNFVLVDAVHRTQQEYGELGFAGPLKGFVLADTSFSNIYANTHLPLASGDVDGTFDLLAYDPGTASWSVAGLLPGEVDPKCDVLINRAEFAEVMTSAGADGEKRVFFETTPSEDCSEPAQLYVRDLVAGTTTAISAPAVEGPLSAPDFIRASADGSAALFLTATKLSADDENDGRDLYLWQEGQGSECLTCVVADANVESAMASPDLSYVYFSSRKTTLVPGRGMSNKSASLYALHEGQLDYVAPVSGERTLGRSTDYSETSADGSVAIFTGNGATPGSVGNQVYRYEAGSGEVQCLSCATSAGDRFEPRTELAGPARLLTDDGGDVVFETTSAIVPHDVNKTMDIYEWRGGKVRLITDGVTEFLQNGLRLRGISGDGRNVLFSTDVHLTGHEIDHQRSLYVARAGGGFPPPPQPPSPCVEDACQGPLQSTPGLSNPASASYAGQGNERAAKAKQRRKKKQHRKKKSAKKHRAKQTKRQPGR